MSNAPVLLSDVEKAQIRHHGGYLNTDPVLSLQLGTPAISQESFIVEGAMNRIRPEAVGIIRQMLQACNDSERNLLEAQRRLRAKQVGNITLNGSECDQLEREYSRWTKRLYEDLGAPRNPYSTRFKDGPPGLSIPVFPT
jgi:hypothetical protein